MLTKSSWTFTFDPSDLISSSLLVPFLKKFPEGDPEISQLEEPDLRLRLLLQLHCGTLEKRIKSEKALMIVQQVWAALRFVPAVRSEHDLWFDSVIFHCNLTAGAKTQQILI